MSTMLDIDDVCATNPLAQQQLNALRATISRTENEREELRMGWIQLQNEIALLIPAIDGERANDPIIRRVERLRAELAEWKATTPAPKPDCRTCAHVYTDMESYGCKRSTTIIVCINGDGYVPSLPVRLYETGGE